MHSVSVSELGHHEIGSHNGLVPALCQAIAWANAVVLSTGSLGTNSSEISMNIQ